jgi:hypothetical protein
LKSEIEAELGKEVKHTTIEMILHRYEDKNQKKKEKKKDFSEINMTTLRFNRPKNWILL